MALQEGNSKGAQDGEVISENWYDKIAEKLEKELGSLVQVASKVLNPPPKNPN